MSETQDDDIWEINRTSPSITFRMEEIKRDFTYNNTTIFRFAGVWAMMNHVYIKREENPPEPCLHIFDSDEIAERLAREGYPVHYEPWPTDGDILAYRNFQRNRLEGELNGL